MTPRTSTAIVTLAILLVSCLTFCNGLTTSDNSYEEQDYGCTGQDGADAERFITANTQDNAQDCAENCDMEGENCKSFSFGSGYCLLYSSEVCASPSTEDATFTHYIRAQTVLSDFLETHGLCTPDPAIVLQLVNEKSLSECKNLCVDTHGSSCVAFAYKYGVGICSIRSSKECIVWSSEHTSWYIYKKL